MITFLIKNTTFESRAQKYVKNLYWNILICRKQNDSFPLVFMWNQTICATAGRTSSSSQLTAANQACEHRGQITFGENCTCTHCPSLSAGISNSRLLQKRFIKLMAKCWFDLCTTNFMARGSLTSTLTFLKTACNWCVRYKGVLHGCSSNNPGPVRLSLTAPLPDIHRPEIPFFCESSIENLAYLCLSVNFPWLCVSLMIKAFCFSVCRSVYRIGLWAILARRGGWVEI